MGLVGLALKGRHLQNPGVLVRAFAVEQSQSGESDAVQNLENGLAVEITALEFAQVGAVVGLVLEALVADRAFAFLVVALHGDLGDDPALHQLVGQPGGRGVVDVQLADAFHAAAVVVLQVVGGDDATNDVVELLRMLQIDLLVHGRHVPTGQLLGGEVVAVLVGAGAAEHEAELGVARRADIHGLGREAFTVAQPDVHGDAGVEVRGGGHRNGFLLPLGAGLGPGSADEQTLLGVGSLAVLGGDGVVVILGLHPALFAEGADDPLHLLLVGIGVIAVGDQPVWDVLGVAEKGLEELAGVGLGDGLVVGLVILDLGVGLDFEPFPIGHEPLHEVVGPLVVGGRKLGGVRRIEVGQIRLGFRQQIVDVLPVCLVLLVVVEDQGVDALQVLAQAILELVGSVLAAAIIGGRREVAEATLAAHAGFAEAEQGDVFLEAGELVAVGADGVDQRMDALGEEDALEVVLNEAARLGVVGQERLDLVLAQANRVVLDDRLGGMVAVAEPVVGDDLEAFGLVHVGHDRRPRKCVEHGANAFRGMLPDPVDELLLTADVVGDVLGALLGRELFRSGLFGGLGPERVGIESQRRIGLQ